MFTPWILLLVTTISFYAAETTTLSITNITTLYPVNKTITRNQIQTRDNDKTNDNEIKPCDTEIRPSDAEIQISDTGIKPNTNQMEINVTKPKSIEPETGANNTETRSKYENKSRPAPQTWKIESSFAESNLTESNKTADVKAVKDSKDKDLLKDFKPSQHLGSFFDYDSAEVIRTPAVRHKKPASGFISSMKGAYYSHETFNKIPKEIYYTHQEFPYKFEDTIFTRTKAEWPDSLESKPTVEVPVKVPAGGLYKSPEAFKEKPSSEEEFGLAIHEDGKEHVIKKRVNPWKNLLRLVTAFIPVGLIISALTPSVITIHNVNDNQQPSLPYRRSDSGGGAGLAQLAPISERCRRRLLCELHSDRNYLPPSSVPRRSMKHCYKIHCEDTEALWRILRWLFTYNQGDDDQRGHRYT